MLLADYSLKAGAGSSLFSIAPLTFSFVVMYAGFGIFASLKFAYLVTNANLKKSKSPSDGYVEAKKFTRNLLR